MGWWGGETGQTKRQGNSFAGSNGEAWSQPKDFQQVMTMIIIMIIIIILCIIVVCYYDLLFMMIMIMTICANDAVADFRLGKRIISSRWVAS